jgi:hypothetical protein
MTLVTPETEGSGTEALLASFHGSIRDLRIVIDGLRQQAASGEEECGIALAQKVLSPAEGLIRTCRKLEVLLEEQRHKELGIAQGGYAIDFDAARFDIGRRLARLRAAQGAEPVSG